MGLNKELQNFIGAYTTIKKSDQDADWSSARSDYYRALVKRMNAQSGDDGSGIDLEGIKPLKLSTAIPTSSSTSSTQDAGTALPYSNDGRTAPVRYANPGAQYPSADTANYGSTGYVKLPDGNKIAVFQDPVHGAAANMSLLAHGYQNMPIAAAVSKWSGGHRNTLPGFDPSQTITPQMLGDPKFMTGWIKQTAKDEGFGNLTDDQAMRAFQLYRQGGLKPRQAAAPVAAPAAPPVGGVGEAGAVGGANVSAIPDQQDTAFSRRGGMITPTQRYAFGGDVAKAYRAFQVGAYDYKPRQSAIPTGTGTGTGKGGTVDGSDSSGKSGDGSSDDSALDRQDVAFSQRGGMITPTHRYATGGEVDDDEDTAPTTATGDDDEEDDGVVASAAPPGDIDQPPPTDISSQARWAAQESLGNPLAGAFRAVRDGVIYNAHRLGIGTRTGLPSPARDAGTRAHLQGDGAATPQEMAAIKNRLDPNHELSESQRNLAAIGTVYNYYMDKGDPAAAQRAAGAMVQYGRQAYSQYAALAKAAEAHGHLDNAIEAAVKAYANVPDGRDLKVTKTGNGYTVQVTDMDGGNVITKQVMSPQQLGALITRVDPGSFDQFILDAAGMRAAKSQGPSQAFTEAMGPLGGQGSATAPAPAAAGPGANADAGAGTSAIPTTPSAVVPAAAAGQDQDQALPPLDAQRMSQMTASEQRAYLAARKEKAANIKAGADRGPNARDAASIKKEVDDAWDGQFSDPDTAPKGADKSTLTNAAFHIRADRNNKLTGDEAVQTAVRATAIDPNKPDAVPFKMTPKKGGVQLQFQGGLSAYVPQQTWDQLVTMRGQRAKAAQAKLPKPEDKNKPGLIDTVRKAVSEGTPAPPPRQYQNPLVELGTRGRVDPDVQSTAIPPPANVPRFRIPQVGPTEVDRINAARRAAGMPPLTPAQIQQIPPPAQVP
jgi:hypothetical protein